MKKKSSSNSDKRARNIVLLRRILIIWGVHTASLLIVSYFDAGISISGLSSAILLAGVLGLTNAILWPLIE